MKTAISLPDELFSKADAAARRLRVSRSQFYAAAISEFLSRQESNDVTAKLNEVYSRLDANLDPALHDAQILSIDKESW
jgi:metal-responsive CopG/Arc/MetJ family transcriptional regulator